MGVQHTQLTMNRPSFPTPDTRAHKTHLVRQLDTLWLDRLGGGRWAPNAWGLKAACAWARHSGLVVAGLLLWLALSVEGGGFWASTCLVVATAAQVGSKRLARWASSPRPFALGLTANHLGHSDRGGMPSTHATVMAATAAFVAVVPGASGTACALLVVALSTGWARVVAGAHFPSDVLAGLALGTTLGLLGGALGLIV